MDFVTLAAVLGLGYYTYKYVAKEATLDGLEWTDVKSRLKLVLLEEELVEMEDIGDAMLNRMTDTIFFGSERV